MTKLIRPPTLLLHPKKKNTGSVPVKETWTQKAPPLLTLRRHWSLSGWSSSSGVLSLSCLSVSINTVLMFCCVEAHPVVDSSSFGKKHKNLRPCLSSITIDSRLSPYILDQTLFRSRNCEDWRFDFDLILPGGKVRLRGDTRSCTLVRDCFGWMFPLLRERLIKNQLE